MCDEALPCFAALLRMYLPDGGTFALSSPLPTPPLHCLNLFCSLMSSLHLPSPLSSPPLPLSPSPYLLNSLLCSLLFHWQPEAFLDLMYLEININELVSSLRGGTDITEQFLSMKRTESTKFMVVLIPFHLISSWYSPHVSLLESPLIVLFKTTCFVCDCTNLCLYLHMPCMYVCGCECLCVEVKADI